MGRTAEVTLVTGWIYSIDCRVPRAEQVKVLPLPYHWAKYTEDADGRLAFIYEPLGTRPKWIDAEIERMKKYPRPAFKEIFDRVDIINEDTGEVFVELVNVNLFGILEGIKEAIISYKGAGA